MSGIEYSNLEEKVDALLSIMEQINNKLDNITIIAKEPIVPKPQEKTKRGLSEQELEKIRLVLRNKKHLQIQFNLKQPPHEARILAYLQTNDPNVFNGLKRNGE